MTCVALFGYYHKIFDVIPNYIKKNFIHNINPKNPILKKKIKPNFQISKRNQTKITKFIVL